jgi:hypothetical protein
MLITKYIATVFFSIFLSKRIIMPEETANTQPTIPSQPVEPPPPRDTNDGSWQTRSLNEDVIVKK